MNSIRYVNVDTDILYKIQELRILTVFTKKNTINQILIS